MKRTCLLVLTFVFLSGFSDIAGQMPKPGPAPEKTEARKASEAKALLLLREVADETGTLGLWENRALLFAACADLLWDTDQKAAKQLFRQSADELLNGIIVPKETTGDFIAQFTSRSRLSSRSTVLVIMASRDADLALSTLNQTRTTELQAAIDRKYERKPPGVQKTPIELEQDRRDQASVAEELALEQTIATKVAEQDPSKAAAIIRRSLRDGVSFSVLELLKKVRKHDEELARSLLDEILDRLLEFNYGETNSPELYTAQRILTEADKFSTNKESDKGNEFMMPAASDLTALAEKIADSLISRNSSDSVWNFQAILPVLLKYAPSRADRLKVKQKEVEAITPDYIKASQQSQELINDTSKTPADLVAAARDYSSWQKSSIYAKAVERAISGGSAADLRRILRSEEQSPERDKALADLDSKLAKEAIEKGEMEKVRALIDAAETKKGKIKLIVELAAGFEKLGTEESHSKALNLIKDAVDLVDIVPENLEEVDDILQVIDGLSGIDPDAAFPFIEGLAVMANDLLMADSLRAKYDKRTVKFIEGEALFSQHLSNSYAQYGKALARLADKDFDRMEQLVENIRRDDIKVLLKFVIVQSVLREKIGFEGNRPAMFTILTSS